MNSVQRWLKTGLLSLVVLGANQHPAMGSDKFLPVTTSSLSPCSAPEYHQFDFWIGDWDVLDKAGDTLGTSHVESALGGCVLCETWHGIAGGEGQSFTSWNPGLHRWEQYWVDGQGVPIFFTGRIEDQELHLRADSATRGGTPLQRRVTLSKSPNGRLRQLSETSWDAGRTWTTEYDFYYVKRGAPR